MPVVEILIAILLTAVAGYFLGFFAAIVVLLICAVFILNRARV